MSLKEFARRRLIDEMLKTTLSSAAVNHVAMVVDDRTLKIISACMKVYDVLEEGVSVVEHIEKKRQPLPDLDALYFISSNPTSLERLSEDFKNDRKPQYRDIFIFLSGPLDPADLETLAQNSVLLPRIKSLIEFNMDFMAYERRVFHLDSTNLLPKLFPLQNPALLQGTASQLASLCVTLGDHPNIRFHNNSLRLSAQLASIVHNRLSKISNLTKKQTTLIILDRSYDVAPFLVHDFTYQAIAYDVLGIPVCTPTGVAEDRERVPDDTFEYEFKTNNDEVGTRRALLGESDDLWCKYRHSHITIVNKSVREEVASFAQDNAAAQLSRKKEMSNEETIRAVRALPHFQEMLAKYWVHVTMSEKCYKELQDRRLIDVANVEQDLATGVDRDGHEVSASKLLSGLGMILSNPDIGMEEKLRLLLLYFTMMDGIKEPERKRMAEAAQLSLDNSECVSRFLKMGIHNSDLDAPKTVTRHTHKYMDEKDRLKYFQRRAKTVDFNLSRFQPLLYTLMEAAAKGNLHGGKFPFVQEPDRPARGASEDSKTTALRANNIIWDWGTGTGGGKTSANSPVKSRSRKAIIVFVIGGISMSEMKCAYEVSHSCDCEIFLGGDGIVTPGQFTKILKEDSQAGLHV